MQLIFCPWITVLIGLVLFACQSTYTMAGVAHIDTSQVAGGFKWHLADTDTDTDTDELSTVRYYRLQDLCTGNMLRITNRKVDLNNTLQDNYKYYDLRVESVGFGLVRFQGLTSQRYVCLNKAGRPVPRVNPGSRKITRNNRCIFREKFSFDHLSYEFQLASNPVHFLEFRRNSRPRPTLPPHRVRHQRHKDSRRRLSDQRTVAGTVSRTDSGTDSRTNHDRLMDHNANRRSCHRFLKIGDDTQPMSRDLWSPIADTRQVVAGVDRQT